MTDVEIANTALALVKKEGIAAFEDETTSARACLALYATARNKVLEDRIWSFAKGLFILDPLADAPTFKYDYQFELPGNVIAPVAVVDSEGFPVAYEVVGRNILSNTKKLYVTAKTKPEDTSLYTPGFCFAVAVLLAAYLAVPLAENRELQAQYDAQYRRLIKDAGAADGSGQSSTGRSPLDLKARRF